jgi:hypothetical protein
MKTKLFTGLALAAALLIAGPAYARDDHRGGGARGHAVAAVHRGGGGARVASAHRGGVRVAHIASRRTFHPAATRGYAVNRNVTRNNVASRNFTRNNVAGRNFTRNNLASRNVGRNSVAFGGNTHANNGHYRYAFASHAGWNHNQQYFWNGHHYRWFNNGWFIIDPFPWVAGGGGYYGPGYYGYGNGGPLSVQVQAALSQQGYYNGPVDGIVGPGTRAAIAAYQRDNGLPVTGTITPGVLNDLGIG